MTLDLRVVSGLMFGAVLMLTAPISVDAGSDTSTTGISLFSPIYLIQLGVLVACVS